MSLACSEAAGEVPVIDAKVYELHVLDAYIVDNIHRGKQHCHTDG